MAPSPAPAWMSTRSNHCPKTTRSKRGKGEGKCSLWPRPGSKLPGFWQRVSSRHFEKAEVSAHTTDLELQSPALGNVVTGREMMELPIVGRNPYSLVTLAPGVVDRGNTGTGPLINGARSNSTAVLLDGAEQRNSTTND